MSREERQHRKEQIMSVLRQFRRLHGSRERATPKHERSDAKFVPLAFLDVRTARIVPVDCVANAVFARGCHPKSLMPENMFRQTEAVRSLRRREIEF